MSIADCWPERHEAGIRYERVDDEDHLLARALGHRSILADPRRADVKDVVDTKIKFCEPFRPFAPSVLAQRKEEYFELPDATAG